MKFRQALLLLIALPLTVATSCVFAGSFYVANLSANPVHVAFTSRCDPCTTPKLITVNDLKKSRGLSYYQEHQRPAPVEVQGRTDSLLTYSIILPPGEAVLMFERYVAGSGNKQGVEVFRGLRVSIEAGADSVTYDDRTVASVLRKWHKYIWAIEVK